MPRLQAREGILAIGRVLILKVSSLATHCLFIRVALCHCYHPKLINSTGDLRIVLLVAAVWSGYLANTCE